MGHSEPLFGEQFTQKINDSLGEHTALLYDPAKATGLWQPSKLAAGDPFREPQPLFKKLDESIIEAERSKLG